MKKLITLFAAVAIIGTSLNAQVQKKSKTDRDSMRVNYMDGKNRKYKPSKDTTYKRDKIDSISNNQLDHKKL